MANTRTDFSTPLTNIIIAYGIQEYVATRIFKPLPVDERVGQLAVSDKSGWDDEDDIRANGASENETDMGWDYIPFIIEKHGLKASITDDDIKYNKTAIDIKGQKARNLKKKILTRLEKRVLGAKGVLRNTANNIFSQHVSWTNPATMTSLDPIKQNASAVLTASGMPANTIVMAPPVADAVITSEEYLLARRFTNDMNKAAGYPDTLWDLNLIVAKGLINGNKKGQGNANQFIMGNDVWIGYVDPSETLTQEVLTYGALLYTEEYAREWYDQNTEATWVGYNYNYKPLNVATECGSLLTNVLT